jgi:hypothetical protein
VIHVLFPSSSGMSCFRGCRTCVTCSVSFFLLWYILLPGMQGVCCMFCFLLHLACLAVGAAGRVLHVLFPSSRGMSFSRDCTACVARSVSFFMCHIWLSGLQVV